MAEQQPNLSVFVGPLNRQYNTEVLRCIMKEALSGFTIQRNDIEVQKSGRFLYACVRLGNCISYQSILEKFQNPLEVDSNLLNEIVMQGKTLIVSEDDTIFTDTKATNKKEVTSEDALYRNVTISSTTETIPPITKERMAAILAGTKSDSSVLEEEIVDQERLFYGAMLRAETNNVEFKKGGADYIHITLKDHVRKHMCAFLNSEGGSLYVGVQDSGTVVGMQLTEKDEENIRLMVDTVMNSFKPPVPPELYTLDFLPVIKPGISGMYLKVIRLTVRTPAEVGETSLYETDDGEVFLRRDGSSDGPLTATDVQEWWKKKWYADIDQLRDVVEELRKENFDLHQQIDIVDENGTAPPPTSKACTIL
ncbi:schlafen-like protein 1 isoform 1-T2 [Discoglossus pictus]